jgi:sialic acid synthase SpsE
VPTSPKLLNLLNIQTLASTFKVPVAYGQHSDNREALLIALAVGAESVFVYVAEEYQPALPDGPNAILCDEIHAILQRCKEVEIMLGSRDRNISPEESSVRRVVRRSIVAAQPIKKGTRINEVLLAYKRPGSGFPPPQSQSLVGKIADRDYATDEDLFYDVPLTDNAGGHVI